jgi:hypothetical protein
VRRGVEPFLVTLTVVYVVVLLAGLLAFVVAAMGGR